MRCLNCHYSLAHLPERRCPECGREFDPNDPHTFEHRTRPTISHGLTLYVSVFLGLCFYSLVFPAPGDFQVFDTRAEGVGYRLRLIAVISAVVTSIAWAVWHVRWRRYKSSQ